MKKIKNLTLAILIGAILVSCKSVTPEDAKKYNEDLIAAESELANKETAFSNIVATDSSKAQKKAAYDALVLQANEALAAINKMEAFDGSTEYLDAGKAYFTAIKGICDVEYKQAFDLITIEGRDRTDEENAQLDKVTTAMVDKSVVALKNMQAAQKVFADKNKFEIEETTATETK
ncbi:MAG: hypothetical protein IPG89_18035 [Bacteroidetes bacterium]|nr:hypothetical protein [Bacteroidota bacterium]